MACTFIHWENSLLIHNTKLLISIVFLKLNILILKKGKSMFCREKEKIEGHFLRWGGLMGIGLITRDDVNSGLEENNKSSIDDMLSKTRHLE